MLLPSGYEYNIIENYNIYCILIFLNKNLLYIQGGLLFEKFYIANKHVFLFVLRFILILYNVAFSIKIFNFITDAKL